MKIIVFLILAISELAFGHGEDKLGPHKGYVKMPGAFHTEVVLNHKNQVEVYLLDMEWKNPVVKNSSVTLFYAGEVVKCVPMMDRFDCQFSKKVRLNKGQLKVLAERSSQKGAEVVYELPLKLLNEKIMPEMNHNTHH